MPEDNEMEFNYEPISESNVRWYYYKAQHSLKALLEAPPIPHRGSILRFCDSDNANLESAFRSRSEHLERLWWSEEAELADTNPKTLPPDAPPPSWADFMVADSDDTVPPPPPGVMVRQGVLPSEVNLEERKMKPSYWPGTCHRVLRGTWFAEKAGEWVPLKESLADCLETAYRSAIWLPRKGLLKPQPDGSTAARLDLNIIDKTGFYALYYSHEEYYLVRDSSLAWLGKMGMAPSSVTSPTRLRLRRGYITSPTKPLLEKEADLKQEQIDDAAAATTVSHFLLVVHGIGQTLSHASITQDALAVRSQLQAVRQEHIKGGGKPVGRIEPLPVQWRQHLELQADVEAAMLMPPGIQSLRTILHSTAVEVLMYLSPLHRADILLSFVASLNAVYAKFMLRNPNFKGPVSILAHSLGSVLAWDVLTNNTIPPSIYNNTNNSNMMDNTTSDLFHGNLPNTFQNTTTSNSGQYNMDPSSPTSPRTITAHIASLREENKRLKAEIALLKMTQQQPKHQQNDPDNPTNPTSKLKVLREYLDSPELQALLSGAAAGAPVDIPPLHFTVDTVILMGSPLGCFLSLRGVNQSRGCGLGTHASEALMRCHPLRTASPLPSVSRVYNLYHPFDPVSYKLEPLAYPPTILSTLRTAFVPLAGGGGKRLHIAVGEAAEGVGSAASRFGSALRGSITFGRSTSSSSYKDIAGKTVVEAAAVVEKQQQGNIQDAGAATATLTATTATDVVVEDITAMESGVSPMDVDSGGGATSPTKQTALATKEQVLTAGAVPAAVSQKQQQPTGDTSSPTKKNKKPTEEVPPDTSLATITGGAVVDTPSGERTGKAVSSFTSTGRLDFTLQEDTLSSQYLAAVGAHFMYWNSPEVGGFVYKAVHGMEVLVGGFQELEKSRAAGKNDGGGGDASVDIKKGSTADRNSGQVDVVEDLQPVLSG